MGWAWLGSVLQQMNTIGLCLGRNKWRVLKMQEDLGGKETVSVVQHSGNAAEYIASALFPARITADQVLTPQFL